MKLFRRMAMITLCLTISPSFANPIDTSVIEVDMDAEECLSAARDTLESIDFKSITTTDNVVQGNDKKKRYFATIQCETDKDVVFFAVSGPDKKKRAELMQSLFEEDESSANTNNQTTKVGDCVIKADSTDKLWQQCDGQSATILGKVPRMVMQHPMLAFDLELPGNNSSRTMQSYMDVGGHQIILLTKTEMTCQGELQVKGSLEQIDLGGKKGTKESYQGWAVHVDEFMCF